VLRVNGMVHKPKILFWDIETTDIELSVKTYSLKNHIKYFSPDCIVRDWSMLGAAWKYEGQPARCISVAPHDVFNDYSVIEILHAVLSDADILVGHNSDSFDLKKFNTRALKHGLPPIPPKQTIDTLKVARKHFAVTSNKLSYLCQFYGLDHKDHSPDWQKIMDGCQDELRVMREYNKKDVIVTEQLYYKLRPYMTNHPNLNTYYDVKDTAGKPVILCPKCGDTHTVRNGFRHTAARIVIITIIQFS